MSEKQEHEKTQKRRDSQKAKQKAQINKQLRDVDLKSLTIEERKELARKERNKFLMIASGIIAFIGLIVFLMQPYKGGPTFGVCKTFVELYVRYPSELRLSMAEDRGAEMRIWFSNVNTYGEHNLDYVQCFYRADDRYGFALDKVMYNRREIDQEIIDRFNPSIPAIVAYPPDLTYPNPLPDNLEGLRLDPNRFKLKLF